MTDFAKTRALFHLPAGMIYLDGNSLGPLPIAATARVRDVLLREWGTELITAWNKADWIGLPRRVGDRIGNLIGAPAGSVATGDTLSVKVFQALAAALALRPERTVVLSDTGNFPSDLYIAEGLLKALGRGLELKLVAPEQVEAALDESVAVTLITEVDYRTGRRHNMAALTAKAHAIGAITVWDLAHSAGAVDIDLSATDADFAVGCTYKYLNGGPGAPAFIYVAPRFAEVAQPILSGWMGHEAPFAFDLDYRPHASVERMRVGTPPVLALAVLDAALDAWEGVALTDIRSASLALCERFIVEVERRCPDLILASPRDGASRGSQVSFRHPQGYAIMQALIANNVIGDFRAPDLIRFGFTPLYIGEADVVDAAAVLERVMRERLWDDPAYATRSRVT